MTRSRRLVVVGVALAAFAFGAVALAVPRTHGGSRTATAVAPGMMSGYSGGMMIGSGSGMMGPGSGMMGGYGTAGTPSAGSLTDVRDWVERWLDSRGFTGFRVSEVMAFSNNDYVAIRDAKGKPAFELLTGRGLGWLMEEPPSMMWNTRYGMMRGWTGGSVRGGMMGSMMGGGMMNGWNGWYGGGSGRVSSVAQAARIADRWLARTRSGERVESDVGGMGHFPGYYTLDTIRDGLTVGMLSVNASTGAVWYHGWHGRFLSEREF